MDGVRRHRVDAFGSTNDGESIIVLQQRRVVRIRLTRVFKRIYYSRARTSSPRRQTIDGSDRLENVGAPFAARPFVYVVLL